MAHIPVPLPGAFAVMSIDAMASLEYLDDPQALLACEKLEQKKYVVYVKDGNFLDRAKPYHECTVEFLLEGLPHAAPDHGVEASMSIPVLPTTAHPLGREPLRPTSGALPWNNCYLSPFLVAEVLGATVFGEDPPLYELAPREQGRHDRLMKIDKARRRALQEAMKMRQTYASNISSVHSLPNNHFNAASTSHSPPPPDLDEGEDSASEYSVEDWEDSNGAANTLDDHDLSYLFPAQRPRGDLTVVRFTHDLSMVDALNSPSEFFAEVEALDRIADASRARRRADTERSNAQEYDDEKPTNLLIGSSETPRKEPRVERLIRAVRRRGINALRRILCLLGPGINE
ncbi:hypothetical protein C8F04DRAFT_1391060 [Mycena alexandri]|uniref:Uncharacterized protein n=1 Tax=Mycena alexandri TaxID=1745969 RepID=A0AAD6X9E2_9AGAR|nr:hypothetical protein C8F04DRAFT_1391060 [Mycena alexandri]